MGQVTCKVPPIVDDAIVDASDEAGLFRSDILKRAILHYMARNPDDLAAFADDRLVESIRLIRGEGVSDRSSSRSAAYDPMEDL